MPWMTETAAIYKKKLAWWMPDSKTYAGADVSNFKCTGCGELGGTWRNDILPDQTYRYCPWCGAQIQGIKVDDEMIPVTVYCDSTGLYSDEECEIENLTEIMLPRTIVEAWYYEHMSEFDTDTVNELKIPMAESTFDLWYSDVYTAESTDGICDFARGRGFQPERTE